MLVQRRRRCTNFKPALVQGVVFAGIALITARENLHPSDASLVGYNGKRAHKEVTNVIHIYKE